jgi:predicted metal-dependent phosphoesterase TrpH
LRSGNIDLHVHTTASDGTLSPAETVREAVAQGIVLLGITDHDTTDGIAEAQEAARETGLALIPGVELSVGSGKREIHVLGYFLEPGNSRLQEALRRLRGARDTRNEGILARLREMGVPVDPTRLQEIAGDGSVGRPHIAAALVEAGHVPSQQVAFNRYLARGKPGYVGGRRRAARAGPSRQDRGAGGD